MENKQKSKNSSKYVITIIVGLFVIIYSLLSLAEDKSTKTYNSKVNMAAQNNKSDFELLGANFKKDGNIKYVVGRIKNTSGKKLGYVQVEINLYDRNGNLIDSTLDNVNNLENNAIWSFKAIVTDEKTWKYEIKEVSGF